MLVNRTQTKQWLIDGTKVNYLMSVYARGNSNWFLVGGGVFDLEVIAMTLFQSTLSVCEKEKII